MALAQYIFGIIKYFQQAGIFHKTILILIVGNGII